MSITKYDKLVRDLIPEIIEASGKRCVCSTLSDEEYLDKLDEKLNEELAEYQESKSMEELADLRRTVDKAIKDLHFVMAGGDPCKVCAKVCMMGEGNCQPVWTGEKTED